MNEIFYYFRHIINLKYYIVMKKNFINLLLITLCLGINSCSQNDEECLPNGKEDLYVYGRGNLTEEEVLALSPNEIPMFTPEMKEMRKAAVILSQYVQMKDSMYVLDIPMEQVKKMGIAEEVYNKILLDLEVSNKAIKEALGKGYEVVFNDVQKAAINYFAEIRNNRSRGNAPFFVCDSRQSGGIVTTGPIFGHSFFYPSNEMGRVIFSCRTNTAITPVYTCKTYIFNVWNAKVKVGNIFKVTEIIVPLAVSGSKYCCGVYFQTSDAQGGSAAWKADRNI